MALATTSLFTRLARLFKHAEAVRDFQSALNTQHTSTVGQYSGAALEFVGNVSRHLESRKVAAQQTSNDLLEAATRTLIEMADSNFTLVTKDVEGAIREVIKQMVGDSDSVNANTITIGSASAGGSNVGNGTFLVSAVAPIVDRYGNRPGNLQLQNVKTETSTARCTQLNEGSTNRTNGSSFSVSAP